jgi:hypothetical protein
MVFTTTTTLLTTSKAQIKSLAGFYPLFVGLVDETQALDLMDNLEELSDRPWFNDHR